MYFPTVACFTSLNASNVSVVHCVVALKGIARRLPVFSNISLFSYF
uniref:Uncharacterized protein n=1 Tax=Rhizophora mucronata TaxID=61149 RepID=A0A2P2PJ17_RHIMU